MSNNGPTRQQGGPRRSVSHDGQTLRKQFQASGGADAAAAADADDDGFTTIASNSNSNTKKKGGGRFANAAAAASGKHNNNSPPRGRVNPTSSFTRPRATGAHSFNKPRPTGSFNKKGARDNNNINNNYKQSNSFHHGGNDDLRSKTNLKEKRSQSFNKPRPDSSFNHSNSSVNANTKAAKQEKYKRSTSRMNSHDVELYLQGDGFTLEQRKAVRLHVDILMQARLQHLDPPPFGMPSEVAVVAEGDETITDTASVNNNKDEWKPHTKCLWNDPTRREQITQVMEQYPNAIPISMKKRTRIRSSKLGDSATGSTTNASSTSLRSSSSVGSMGSLTEGGGDDTNNNLDGDDSSLGTSTGDQPSATTAGSSDAAFVFNTDQEDMNPLRKTLLLLNKLSWTTIDILTPKLFHVLEVDVPKLLPPPPPTDATKATTPATVSDTEEDATTTTAVTPNTEVSPMVLTILNLLMDKGQTEPHFGAMYATLCRNLAERNPAWKRKMLAHCQTEFEHDVSWHMAKLDERLANKKNKATMEDGSCNTINTINTAATEDMDRDYQVQQIRNRYTGHVQFVGELFKLKLIKPDIMIWCLSRLLFHKEEADEDDLGCFAKLMAVVGEQAEYLVENGKCHAVAEEKWFQCWDRVYFLVGRKNKKRPDKPLPEGPPPKISSRIKFMLIDLLDLEENDWVHRRKKERPKTIAEIHKEVKEEEAAALRKSKSHDFSGFGSFGNRRRVNSSDNYPSSPKYNKPKADTDGFTSVPKKKAFMRRAVSDMEVSDLYKKDRPKAPPQSAVPSSPATRSKTVKAQLDGDNATPKIVEYPDPEECKEKSKNILKEYFTGGDTDEAIRSIDEVVGAGSQNEKHGSVERGAAVIEAGVLLVMEMKQQEVQKFLAVIKRCLQKKKIEKASLPLGLKDPLEFLSDIEIDAPLARSLLTSIVAYWVRQDALPFDFLLGAPELFRTDGKPAEFAVAVLKVRGSDATESDLSVVEKLMTEDDKKKFSSAKEMVGPFS